jgi:hypothetical protein
MNLCLFDFCFDIIELPPFMPNEYLLRTHADKIKNPEGSATHVKDVKIAIVEKSGLI